MSLQTEVTRLQGIKGDIQTALVNKGVSGAGSHTMSQFATDIAGISTGTDVSDTTATASDVLSGKAFYLANGTKANGTIGTGALSTPTVNSSGLVTASVGTTGYMTSGTSSTLQLSTQSAKTVTPSTSSQTAVASGRYTTGAVTVSAMPSGALSTPTVNSTGLVTASVGTSGYLASGTSSTLQIPLLDGISLGGRVGSMVSSSAWGGKYTGTIYGAMVDIYEMSGTDFANNIYTASVGGQTRQCFTTPFHAKNQVIGFYFRGYVGGTTYGVSHGSFFCMPTTSIYMTQFTMYLLGSHTSNTSILFNKGGSGQQVTNKKAWYCGSSTSNFYFDTDLAEYSTMYILYVNEDGEY